MAGTDRPLKEAAEAACHPRCHAARPGREAGWEPPASCWASACPAKPSAGAKAGETESCRQLAPQPRAENRNYEKPEGPPHPSFVQEVEARSWGGGTGRSGGCGEEVGLASAPPQRGA